MVSDPDVDLLDGDFWAGDHHAAFTWMRANAPVYLDRRNDVWAITTHADIKAISTDVAHFSNSGGIRPDNGPLPMMIDMDDPDHWARRKLVNRGFTPKRVRAQDPAIRSACDEIIDRVCDHGEADFVRDIAAPLPMIMIGDALGVAPEDRERLLTWSDDMLKGLTGHRDDGAMIRAGEAFGAYTEYAARVIAERRARPTNDLMSVLVGAEVDGDRLADDAIIQESLLILIGGDETTRHVLTGGMYQLLRHREQFEALRADRSLLDGAVEEMLRWVSPIKNMARLVVTDVEFGGQQLRAGQKLLLVYPSGNRDETVFDRPFEFDIRREPNDHVAFGFGAHFCLGNSLARRELAVMLDTVLDRFPDLQLVDNAEPAARAANFISGYESMPVRFTPAATRR